MAKSKRAAAVTETVPDVDTEKAILVARVSDYGRHGGSWNTCLQFLTHLGLRDLVQNAPAQVTVKVADLIASLPEELTVEVPRRSDGTLRESTLSDVLRSKVYEAVSEVTTLSEYNTESDMYIMKLAYTVAEPSTTVVNVEETLSKWGQYNSDLPATTADGEQYRRDMVASVLDYAEQKGYCDTVERYLQALGYEAYLPPRSGNFTVSVNGVDVEMKNVPLNRKGQPSDFAYYLSNALVGMDTSLMFPAQTPSAAQ